MTPPIPNAYSPVTSPWLMLFATTELPVPKEPKKPKTSSSPVTRALLIQFLIMIACGFPALFTTHPMNPLT